MYGFNLGQIEGLDSSVQTVTATVADQSTNNTYTLSYNETNTDWEGEGAKLYDLGSSQGYALEVFAFIVSDVGDTYNVTLSVNGVEENFKSAVETVLADNGLINAPETLFDGTITITAENTQGVEIPFDMDVSSYPFEKWTVTINGLEIPYQAGHEIFQAVDDNIGYLVLDNDGVYTLQVIDIQGAGYPPVPGDYQLKIVGVRESGGGSGLPAVTTDDDGKMLQVEDAKWSVVNYPIKSENSVTLCDDTVTLTNEDADVPFEAGADISNPSSWTVKINGIEIPKKTREAFEYSDNENEIIYGVYLVGDTWKVYVTDLNDTIIPGDYSVEITSKSVILDENFVKAIAVFFNLPNEPMDNGTMNINVSVNAETGKPLYSFTWEPGLG